MSERLKDDEREARRRARIAADHQHRRRGQLVKAIDEFKKVTGLTYVPFVEVLRIARELGYRRGSPAATREEPEI